MTNELDDGDYIIDFTSAGPKNYGYKTKNDKVCCKVCGFTRYGLVFDKRVVDPDTFKSYPYG